METIKQLRNKANEAGKSLVYNRSLGGYQIMQGFTASDVEFPFRDEKGRLCLEESQIKKLASYI